MLVDPRSAVPLPDTTPSPPLTEAWPELGGQRRDMPQNDGVLYEGGWPYDVEWITVILSNTIMVGNLMNNTGPRSHVGIIM